MAKLEFTFKGKNKRKNKFTIGCMPLILIVILTIITLASCSVPDSIIGNEYISIDNYEYLSYDEADILYFINYERNERGLSTLTSDQFARDLEYTHIDFLVQINDINHDGFFARKAELTNRGVYKVSEILAMKFNNPEAVVNAWMNSLTHINAILNPIYDAAGIVVIENQYGEKWYGVLFIDYK